MLLRVFWLLDHLASGACGAAVRSELPAARNAACGPPPLSSRSPPPSFPPSLDRIASSSPSCRRSPFFSSLPALAPPPPSDLRRPLLSMSPRKFPSASLAPPGGHCAMWPRRTPAHAARPHGAARSRIPPWRAPRLPISFCPFAGLRRNSRFPPRASRPVACGGFPLCAHRGLVKSDGCLWGVLLLLLTGFACFRFLASDCCAMLPRSTTRPDWGHSCVVARRNVVRVVAGCSNATAGCCDLRVVGFAALRVAPFAG